MALDCSTKSHGVVTEIIKASQRRHSVFNLPRLKYRKACKLWSHQPSPRRIRGWGRRGIRSANTGSSAAV